MEIFKFYPKNASWHITFIPRPNENDTLGQTQGMEKIPFLQVINSEKHTVGKDLEWFYTPFPFLEAEVADIIPGEKYLSYFYKTSGKIS